MIISRIWAMPNKWTFKIKPIHDLIYRYLNNGIWIDPYCGLYSPARITNDLNPDVKADYHLDALDFLKSFKNDSIDGIFFDPPYSPRQVSECYKGFGMKVTMETTQQTFWSYQKDEIARILKIDGLALCFGWNSMGINKNRGMEMIEVLLVPHGGNKNDTIVTVERKTSINTKCP